MKETTPARRATVSPPGPELRLTEVMAALSIATDVGMGLAVESGRAVCLAAVRLGESAGLSQDQLARAFYLSLLRHIGCTAVAHGFATAVGDELAIRERFNTVDPTRMSEVMAQMLRFVAASNSPSAVPAAMGRMLVRARGLQESQFAVCEVAEMLADRMGFDREFRWELGRLYERWDGKGPRRDGGGGEPLTAAARVIPIAECAVLLNSIGGEAAAVETVRGRAGRSYDPAVADAFCRNASEILAGLSAPSLWDAVVDDEPGPRPTLAEDRLDAALRAIADFTDLKSPFTVGHSSGVAFMGAGAAERLGLPGSHVATIRRAGWVHDVGRVGISAAVWAKPGPLTAAEWERVRMHPYHTDRILARPIALASLSEIASMHHERLDGSGYFRRVSAAGQPVAARILQAADAFHAMTEQRPHRPALGPEAASKELREEVRAGRLDPDAAAAVQEAAGRPVQRRRDQVAGLTAREVEVLRLVARGLTTRQVARVLSISPKTADVHLQHIYAKAGVSTRAAATLFALQHDLLDAGPPAV